MWLCGHPAVTSQCPGLKAGFDGLLVTLQTIPRCLSGKFQVKGVVKK